MPCRALGAVIFDGMNFPGILGWPARWSPATLSRQGMDRSVTMNGWAGLNLLGETSARRRSRSHDARIRDRRILYVDDDLLLRLSVARLLRGAGAVCIGTGTHAEAAVLLAFEPDLDLAILDFEMPDGDVGRLVRRLHWQRPALPVVGTCAGDRSSEFAARGVSRFLPKPWVLDDLIQVADWSEGSES